ncbi:unnamed protein product [Somion occarium]|uniref:Uncharacterized protein n=1 Tax=Somion occarium TaxID=3059160 RepID=A0ABP1DUK1_9APHY
MASPYSTSKATLRHTTANTKAEFGSPAPPSATTPAPSTTAPSNDEYPEQRHAGRVGLGPNYGKGASGGDKLAGWKEELAGKITRNPDKVHHGHDLRTGELKKKEQEEEKNPFEKNS